MTFSWLQLYDLDASFLGCILHRYLAYKLELSVIYGIKNYMIKFGLK